MIERARTADERPFDPHSWQERAELFAVRIDEARAAILAVLLPHHAEASRSRLIGLEQGSISPFTCNLPPAHAQVVIVLLRAIYDLKKGIRDLEAMHR